MNPPARTGRRSDDEPRENRERRANEQERQRVGALVELCKKVGIVGSAIIVTVGVLTLFYGWAAAFASRRFEAAIEPFVQRLEAGERRDSLIVSRLESIGTSVGDNTTRMSIIGDALHYEIGTAQRARALRRLDSLNGVTR